MILLTGCQKPVQRNLITYKNTTYEVKLVDINKVMLSVTDGKGYPLAELLPPVGSMTTVGTIQAVSKDWILVEGKSPPNKLVLSNGYACGITSRSFIMNGKTLTACIIIGVNDVYSETSNSRRTVWQY